MTSATTDQGAAVRLLAYDATANAFLPATIANGAIVVSGSGSGGASNVVVTSGTLTGITNGVTLASGVNNVGTVAVSGGTVTIANPGSVGSAVSVTNFPGTQTVVGTVTVANPGSVGSNVSLLAGAASIGNVGVILSGSAVSSSNPLPSAGVPSAAAGFGIAPIVSTALETAHVLKASPGNLYSLNCTSEVAGYLLVLNATAVPALTSGSAIVSPIQFISVVSGSTTGITFNPGPPEYYSSGIVALFSTSSNPFVWTPPATPSTFFHGSVQ